MLVALTGTPGTGKSSVAKILRKKGYKVIALNRVILKRKLIKGFDKKRKSWIVDIKKAERYLKEVEKKNKNKIIVIDSHISHLLNVDFAIILRCSPEELEKRLKKKRWPKQKIIENVEAEIIDVIPVEAEENLGKENIVEIDTTRKKPEEIAKQVEIILKNLDKKKEL